MFLIAMLTTLLSVFLLFRSSAGHLPYNIPDNTSGYVDVRPSAHMFWWLYGSTNPDIPRNQLPLVMWLQVGSFIGLYSCILGTVYASFYVGYMYSFTQYVHIYWIAIV